MLARSPFLRILSEVLNREQDVIILNPPLPIILLSVIDHLADVDSEKIPKMLAEQHQLSPTSSDWIENWELIFNTEGLFKEHRPITQNALKSSYPLTFSL